MTNQELQSTAKEILPSLITAAIPLVIQGITAVISAFATAAGMSREDAIAAIQKELESTTAAENSAEEQERAEIRGQG